jgi:two-component system, NarL family, nitrate/nitrite response regulator NarL
VAAKPGKQPSIFMQLGIAPTVTHGSVALAETTDQVTRILLADDHTLFRGALRWLIDSEPDMQVIGEAATVHETMLQLKKLHPDILLLDLNMPPDSGMEVLRRMADAQLSTRAVLLVAGIMRNEILEALRLGARGVVFKDTASKILYKCIRIVMMGEYWVDQACISDLVSLMRSTAPRAAVNGKHGKFGLTAREREIVATVMDGYTNKDIAQKFALSEQTVKHHLTRIFEKVGVANRLELALLAMNQGILDET